MSAAATPLVSVCDLAVEFHRDRQTIAAVNGVSFDLALGEVLGVLGESGSGKSVTLRALLRLQQELGMSVIFVTHDVGVAVEVADRLAVMYAGRLVEIGSMVDVIESPSHPYTQGLLSSIVRGEMRGKRIEAIPGSPPDLASLPGGCSFAPRCKHARAECGATVPELLPARPGQAARCVLLREPSQAATV